MKESDFMLRLHAIADQKKHTRQQPTPEEPPIIPARQPAPPPRLLGPNPEWERMQRRAEKYRHETQAARERASLLDRAARATAAVLTAEGYQPPHKTPVARQHRRLSLWSVRLWHMDYEQRVDVQQQDHRPDPYTSTGEPNVSDMMAALHASKANPTTTWTAQATARGYGLDNHGLLYVVEGRSSASTTTPMGQTPNIEQTALHNLHETAAPLDYSASIEGHRSDWLSDDGLRQWQGRLLQLVEVTL